MLSLGWDGSVPSAGGIRVLGRGPPLQGESCWQAASSLLCRRDFGPPPLFYHPLLYLAAISWVHGGVCGCHQRHSIGVGFMSLIRHLQGRGEDFTPLGGPAQVLGGRGGYHHVLWRQCCIRTGGKRGAAWCLDCALVMARFDSASFGCILCPACPRQSTHGLIRWCSFMCLCCQSCVYFAVAVMRWFQYCWWLQPSRDAVLWLRGMDCYYVCAGCPVSQAFAFFLAGGVSRA